jgi:hypothetical protein
MARLHLPIQNPCHEDWDAMNREAAGRRFCEVCTKQVHDLSVLTEPEARQVLVRESAKGRVCVRYTLDEVGEIKFRPQTTEAPSRWRMTWMAAGLAVGLLSGCADGGPDRVRADACVYEVGPWNFELARGEGTCPASDAVPEPPEPSVMGEIEAIPPEPEPEIRAVKGEAPLLVEPPPPPPTNRRMGKIAPPKVEVEMMGDVAAVPDEPCEPIRAGPRRL